MNFSLVLLNNDQTGKFLQFFETSISGHAIIAKDQVVGFEFVTKEKSVIRVDLTTLNSSEHLSGRMEKLVDKVTISEGESVSYDKKSI